MVFFLCVFALQFALLQTYILTNGLNPLIDMITGVLNNIDIITFYKYTSNIITRECLHQLIIKRNRH